MRKSPFLTHFNDTSGVDTMYLAPPKNVEIALDFRNRQAYPPANI